MSEYILDRYEAKEGDVQVKYIVEEIEDEYIFVDVYIEVGVVGKARPEGVYVYDPTINERIPPSANLVKAIERWGNEIYVDMVLINNIAEVLVHVEEKNEDLQEYLKVCRSYYIHYAEYDKEERDKQNLKILEEKRKFTAFLEKLSKLTDDEGVAIGGCGCCGSPYLSLLKEDERQGKYTYEDELTYVFGEGE